MTSKEALRRFSQLTLDRYHQMNKAGKMYSFDEKTYNLKQLDKDFLALKKIVERDTPMKVIKDDDSSVISANCPKCKRVVDIGYNGCPYCLQRLDWSKRYD